MFMFNHYSRHNHAIKYLLSWVFCARFIRVVLFFSSIVAATIVSSDPKTKAPQVNPSVKLETDLGVIVLELLPKEAPKTVANFLQYVDSGFYNGTIFHRIVPGFVVQGGGLTYDFQRKKTQAPIVNEANNMLKNEIGTLSMARTSNPNSATSQFFINVAANTSLDYSKNSPGYAVFAKVKEGLEVVKKIEKEPRGIHRAHPEAPNYPVRILKAYRLKAK